MLARLIACLFCGVSAVAGNLKPNVVVIVSSTMGGTAARAKLDAKIPDDTPANGVAWRRQRAGCSLPPGRAATLSALLYGEAPLVSGVVGDYDWRRKPVRAESLAGKFAKAGYNSVYCGAWGLGNGRPYRPIDRGFKTAETDCCDQRSVMCRMQIDQGWGTMERPRADAGLVVQLLTEVAAKGGPVFAVVSNTRGLPVQLPADALAAYAANQWANHGRDTWLVLVCVHSGRRAELRGRVPDGYHTAAELSVYHYGHAERFRQMGAGFAAAATGSELHHACARLLGGAKQEKQPFRIFHKANWPLTDSPDKYRHRGSLVVGKGHALVDGLQLYPATKDMLPDLSNPLDISRHRKLHAEMLAAHAKWWAKARPALYDPRAFDVGEKDKVPVKLTVLDWRPSRTIRADKSSPSAQPLVYQKDLLGILRELKNGKYRNAYPAHSGSWSVNIRRPGRYQITASLLPTDMDARCKKLARLRGGRAFVRLGGNLVQLQIAKGATSVTVQTDADAGVTDLECWFTGQLALERELGAFFVEIQRVGEKKFEFEAK